MKKTGQSAEATGILIVQHIDTKQMQFEQSSRFYYNTATSESEVEDVWMAIETSGTNATALTRNVGSEKCYQRLVQVLYRCSSHGRL